MQSKNKLVPLKVKLLAVIRMMGFDFAQAVKMTDAIVTANPSVFE